MNAIKSVQLDKLNHELQLPGLTCIGSISNAYINRGIPIPLYEPVNLPNGINTQEGWNALADKQNRRSFAVVFGRVPNNDAELRAWVETL